MARNTTKIKGVTVVLPKGRRKKLTDKQRDLATKEINRRRVKNRGSRCRVVFFKASEAVMRCEGSSLSRKAKTRFKKLKGKKVCRHPTNRGPKAKRGRFKKCRR